MDFARSDFINYTNTNMTKEEMLSAYFKQDNEKNYQEAQKQIKEAMENGKQYVYLPGKNGSEGEFKWSATEETISRLKEDGFDIDVMWDPWEYWSVEWGY